MLFRSGLSWFKTGVIDKTNDTKQITDYTAYSDIVLLNKNTIGILYEKENYSKIVFTLIKWKKEFGISDENIE